MSLTRPLTRLQQWTLARTPSPLRRIRIIPGPALALISLLVVVNIVVWIITAIVLHFYPGLAGTAVLAYTLGLRHALDADHISAIDLMTRRLIASGQRPVAVGTFFSLGHSTIVIITCIVVAATAGALRERFDGFQRVGNIIGTSVSAAVLLILCAGNAWVLWRLVRGLRAELKKQRQQLVDGQDDQPGDALPPYRDAADVAAYGGAEADADAVATHDIEAYDEEAHARARAGPNAVAAATAPDSQAGSASHLRIEGGGFLVRIFRKLFVLIDRPWKMYPLGVLFGLGFDTSSEVALLGIASIQGAKGTSMWLILIFPALFTGMSYSHCSTHPERLLTTLAGMCMIDTTDGALMMALYTSKAFSRDTVAILYYSIVLTGITIVVALFIGIVQVLTLVSNVASPTGRFWDGVGAIGDNYDIVGGTVCGVFVVAGISSVLLYRPWRRHMDRRLAARAARAARAERGAVFVQAVDQQAEEPVADVRASSGNLGVTEGVASKAFDSKTQQITEQEIASSSRT